MASATPRIGPRLFFLARDVEVERGVLETLLEDRGRLRAEEDSLDGFPGRWCGTVPPFASG